jgi:O-antigen/teichoic acid export membrane protein
MSYGRRTFYGVLFVSAGVIATKLSSFIAQFVLGWLLTTEDYKVLGMLASLRMFVEGIRNGGALPVMQQQRAKSSEQAGQFFKYGLIFNLLSAVILLASAPLAERYFRAPELFGLIALVAVSFPLSTPGAFYRTQLSIDLRFAESAKIVSLCAVLNYAVMILCAALGLGPYAFVWPIIVSALAEWWLYGKASQRRVYRGRLSGADFLRIFRASKWIMLAAIAMAVALSGDYLVIGLVAADLLGEYLFGFQLTVAFSAVISIGLYQVLLPTFSSLQHDTKRIAGAYRKAVIMTSLVVPPVFCLSAILAPLVVHFLWAGKWDAAIPVVQAMSLCLIFRLFNPLSSSVLQAVGRWDRFATTMFLDAAIVVLAAWLGTQTGGLPEISIAVGLGRCLPVPLMIAAAARAVGLSPWRILGLAAVRIALPIASVCIGWLIYGFPSELSARYLIFALLSLACAEALTMWLYRHDVGSIRNLIRQKRETPTVELTSTETVVGE